MTLSVIIPVYNAEKHLDKCLESLVNQTYKDLEIILINDGSTDKSGTLCDEWAAKDSRIKIIHKQKVGVSSARNRGLDAATGEYILFADCAGTFASDAFAKAMAAIEKDFPDLLVFGFEKNDGAKPEKVYMDTNLYTRYEYNENISRYISTGVGFETVTNKVFASHIITVRCMRFSEDMPLVADQLFNCRFFTAAGHIKCIADVFALSGAENLVHPAGTADYLRQGKEYSQKLIDAVQSKGLYSSASAAIMGNYRKILYRHLVLLAAPNENLSEKERVAALEAVYNSPDDSLVQGYLSVLPGIKNKLVYQMYKLRQWKAVLAALGK